MKFRNYLALLLFISACSSIEAKVLFSKFELENPRDFKYKFDSVFHRIEMPVARYAYGKSQVVLENSYASSVFKNPDSWKSGPILDSLCLILSKYPAKEEDWLINFYDLLASRLQALYVLAPEANDSRLKHILILQTSCKTEEQAKNLFHGFVIFAHPKHAHLKQEPGWVGNSTLLENNDSLLAYDSSYIPQTNMCFHHGTTYDIEVFENKVWIAWENGLFVTADTFQKFDRMDNGLHGDTLIRLCTFQSKLYGLSRRGTVCLWNGKEWQFQFTPGNSHQLPESLIASEDVLIAVYSEDDFFISGDGKNFVNRRYKVKTGDKWEIINLSPGSFVTQGDSILFSSGNKLFLSRDNLLNIRVLYEFPKNQLAFIQSFIIDGIRWYVCGMAQDPEDQHIIYSTLVSVGNHTVWGSIHPPEKSFTFYQLYQRKVTDPIWFTGGGQDGFLGTRTYIRKQEKWFRMDIPATVIGWYGGYYLAPGMGGNLFLITEPGLQD